MSSEAPLLLSARGVSKMYKVYARPIDRLKQTVFAGTRSFYREFWALRGVDLDVRRGESIGIIGRNGSGKSTLLQVLAGVLQPTEGAVEAHGRVGALLELGSGFNPEFTGRENVLLQGALLGFPRAQMLERFDSIAEFADIGPFIEQPVKTYSSGMYVRLAFAVHAQLEPDLLIVDEALAVGDEKFQRKCFARLEQLQARGSAILLVTHSAPLVEKYCQRAMLLEQGRMHALGRCKDVINQYHALLYADEEAYLRYRNQAAKAQALAAAPASPAASTQVEVKDAAPDASSGVPTGDGPAALTSDRARIEDVWALDASGKPRELFTCGDEVEVGFRLLANADIERVQAGLRLRTVEGVEVYGTSTSYVERSADDVRAGDRVAFRFRFALDLCVGTYFVSIAAAETLPGGSMVYLDKRSDILMIKVRRHPVVSTGIAELDARVSVEVSRGEPASAG